MSADRSQPFEVVSLGPPPRLRLRDVELAPAQRLRLRLLVAASVLSAALAAVSVFLPFHDYRDQVHTGLDHGGIVALLPAAWMIALAWAAWRRPRWGWMMAWAAAGTLAGLFAFAVAVAMVLDHLFEDIPSRIGESLHMVGALGQLFAPALGLVGVPLEFLRARRRGEEQARSLPTARARRGGD